MIINISPTKRIISNDSEWTQETLETKGEKAKDAGVKYWKNDGKHWHSTLVYSLLVAFRESIHEDMSSISTIAEMYHIVEKAEKRIREAYGNKEE
jgi:hypothetical protein